MLKLKFSTGAILLLACYLDQATGQGCFRNFLRILELESKVTNIAVRRTYTLCAGTTFRPTFLRGDGFTDSGYPLAVRANAQIKCGTSGSSSNNCIIDGTGSYGIFIESGLFGDEDIGAILLQGITLDFWTSSNQIPLVIAVYSGQVTLLDCIIQNNQVDPIAFIDQYVIDQFSKRSLELSSPSNETEKPKPRWNFNYFPGPKNSPFARRLNDDFPDRDANNSTIVLSSDRKLQLTTSKLTVIFEKCQFLSNSPVKVAVNQNGLSILRFRARNPSIVAINDPSKFREYVGTLDARIIDSVFDDNNFAFSGDPATYRSIIDFYSKGTLVLRSSCFINAPVKNFGVVTIQNTASLVQSNNFLSSRQSSLECAFIARLSSNYDFIRCGPSALATTCPVRRASQATLSFCFPGDCTCQVEGQGKVPLKDIKLGDRVLVASNKYESVYSFGHRATEVTAEYIQLITPSTKLELSRDHMVFLDGGHAVPASNVKVGDKLENASGSPSTVTAIRDTVVRQGAYALFTPSGTVIVNDIKSSSFVALQHESATFKIAGFDTGVTFQFLAHTFEVPHRFWCQYVSACKTERYTSNGFSMWVAIPRKVVIWYMEQNPAVMTMLAVPASVIVSVLAFPLSFLCFLLTLLVVTHRRYDFRSKASAQNP